MSEPVQLVTEMVGAALDTAGRHIPAWGYALLLLLIPTAIALALWLG